MRVFLDSVGCRLNQAEIEAMAGQFRAAGHEIVGAADNADLAVVNTCAVTAAAASDSRGKIRRAARDGAARIVVTGCWSTLEPEAAAALPSVSSVIANDRKDELASEVLDIPAHAFEVEPIARVPLPGVHRRTRAFIKVQDGCDNRCGFCITTIARGRGRSRAAVDVIRDIESALGGGAKEIVLTGVHLGSWGKDLGSALKQLVLSVLRETSVPRLRLSSLEPWDLDRNFFALWEDPRLCPHLHLPLQSGCAATLRRMRRNTTPDSFSKLVKAAREVVPEAAITTDVIAGFPGETEREFAESLDFVREMEFAGGHAFTYSSRAGTAAAKMADEVPGIVRTERTRGYRAAFASSSRRYREKFLGKTRSVLWEAALPIGDGAWQLTGLTDNYLRVQAEAGEPRWNQMEEARLLRLTGDGIQGIIVK